VVEPGANSTVVGSPWDRRRLLESLRSAGVARDPAGEIAREVERRLVGLGQERISAALIHALASLLLSGRAMDVRPYSARRLAFSLSTQMPHYDAASEKISCRCILTRRAPSMMNAGRPRATSLIP